MKKLIVLLVVGLGLTLALAQENTVTISQFIKATEGFSTLTAALNKTASTPLSAEQVRIPSLRQQMKPLLPCHKADETPC